MVERHSNSPMVTVRSICMQLILLLQTVYSISNTINCQSMSCNNTVIQCPYNIDCIVDCTGNHCINTTLIGPVNAGLYINFETDTIGGYFTVNASSSIYFELDAPSYIHGSIIYNMSIYCPQNGRGGTFRECKFFGYEFDGGHIFAEEGFRDIHFGSGQQILSNVYIHCGATETEYQCLSNSRGSKCRSGDIICDSTFLIPSNEPTHEPSHEPSNIPTVYLPVTNDPSQSPSNIPTNDPSNTPTTNPTLNPTEKPTIGPTQNPMIYKPSISPTPTPILIVNSSPTISPVHGNGDGDEQQNEVISTTISTTMSNNEFLSDSNNYSSNIKVKYTGYCVILLLCLIAVICTLCGLIYHGNIKGSDKPNYYSLWSYFINIADTYTDFLFCIVLYLSDSDLFFFSIIFTSISHLLSILYGLYMVHKWRNNKLGYINKYDNLIIGLTILSGFYPCINLLSSKLFHSQYTSLQLTSNEKYMIRQIRFITHCLFENIPLIIIQIIAIVKHPEINDITLIALSFSLFCIIHEILTFSSRICGICSSKKKEEWNDKAVYKLDITSSSIKQYHLYSHKLFAKAMSSCLVIEPHRIETISIISIVNGISCNISIVLDDDENKIDQLINDINKYNNNICYKCKIALSQKWNIKFGDDGDGNDMNIITTKIDGNTIGIIYQPPNIQLINLITSRNKELIDMQTELINIHHQLSSDPPNQMEMAMETEMEMEGPKRTETYNSYIIESDSSSSSDAHLNQQTKGSEF